MIVGLTGGIASGKSLVTAYLRELDIPVIDTDEIARQVVAPGQPAWHRLSACFGAAYFLPDGALDRSALAHLVFQDTEARRRLEAIVHPAIYAEVERRLSAFQHSPTPPALIVVVVPLLFETGAETRFDATVLVTTTVAAQRARLRRTRGYTLAQADARIAAQLPLDMKVARSTYVLENHGTKTELRQQVRALLHKLRDARPSTLPE
jgi:dephospho-CoA kinase